ncbi:hypothetical protein [Polaromonas hydrogenivorans]|uniref:hypothetical protein n=1 Tax=Polaromonas hydrogenivorans TaxID=335476 RepID=UPI0039EFF0C2
MPTPDTSTRNWANAGMDENAPAVSRLTTLRRLKDGVMLIGYFLMISAIELF